MNVSILGESKADEAAIRILVDAILGCATSPLSDPFRLRSRGVDQVLRVFRNYVRHLYARPDVDGAVIVVDSDRTPVHVPEHDQPGGLEVQCRLCFLRHARDEVLRELAARPRAAPLKIAIGVAVPSIEAWYCRAGNVHPSEASWIRAIKSKQFPYDVRKLKREVYGSEREIPALEHRMMEEATRIAANVDALLARFPTGLGALVSDLNSW